MEWAGRQRLLESAQTLEHLSVHEIIGHGASSFVKRAVHDPTGTQLALKYVNVFNKAKQEQVVKELNALYEADCSAITTLHGAFYKEPYAVLALEYMDAGNLQQYLETVGALPEKVAAAVSYQILWALAYLRVERKLHRDLKPSNCELQQEDG